MALFESNLSSLALLSRGKVRDIYAVDDQHLLIITTDRLSAFDVILPDPIPDKGIVLNQLALFWFKLCADILPNQLTDIQPEDVVSAADHVQVKNRAMVVKRLQPLPIEAVVRGYLIGSGWKDYQQNGEICGIRLPTNLPLAAQLPEAIFTPATKAEQGDHDENISYEQAVVHCQTMLHDRPGYKVQGEDLMRQTKSAALAIYQTGAKYALPRGVIIADSKFEFGIDDTGVLHLIDEVLTPDSSRFWSADHWQTGISPPSWDKQFVRDYLETLAWPKKPPAPSLPSEVIQRTRQKYCDVYQRLTGKSLDSLI